MKITIELIDSVEARIHLDGRDLKLIGRQGVWNFEGFTDEEAENTIGGAIASHLMSPLINILQAHIPDTESPDGDCWETWEKLDEETAETICQQLW